MTQSLGWALIGASNVAREWMIGAIQSCPGNVIHTVFSGDAERGRTFAEENGIQHSTTVLGDVLNNPDIQAVYISSRNEFHKDQAIAALRAGKHVLCEKPLALTLSDAEEMVRVGHEADVVLAINHHLRCSAVHLTLRNYLKSGMIGALNSVRVFHANHVALGASGWRLNDAGGGLVLDSTIHDIDTLRFLLDANPVEVSAMTQSGHRSTDGIEDGILAVMRFPGDVLVQIHGSYAVPYAPGGIELYGDNAALIARNCMSQKPIGGIVLRNGDGEHSVTFPHHNLYRYSIERFCESVRKQGRPAATGEDGLAALKIALALKESARTGRAVRLIWS